MSILRGGGPPKKRFPEYFRKVGAVATVIYLLRGSPRAICHTRLSCRCVFVGRSQPLSVNSSARFKIVFLSRMMRGADRWISRKEISGRFQCFTIHSRSCVVRSLHTASVGGGASRNVSFCFCIGDFPYFLWGRGLDGCVHHKFFISAKIYNDVDPIDVVAGSVGSGTRGLSQFFYGFDLVARI